MKKIPQRNNKKIKFVSNAYVTYVNTQLDDTGNVKMLNYRNSIQTSSNDFVLSAR